MPTVRLLAIPTLMCGIAGYAGISPNESLLAKMTKAIEHRGPDDFGWTTSPTIGLGMRRLSIIDRAGGKQPMHSPDGNFSIVFNGEIYNYPELRKELLAEGYPFKTHSDTETLLALYLQLGSECVHKLRGMFVFSILDRKNETLFIARDRLGVKPLYYYDRNGHFLFASEIKSLLEHEDISAEPNLPAIDSYLSLRYVPGPDSLFQNIHKFPAGHWMHWKKGQKTFHRYWTAPFNLSVGKEQPDEYFEERFAELFEESVKLRLLSEVPVGAYLSAGTDSTAIVAAMSHLTNNPVRTFSVGFNWSQDELAGAKETANRLNTEHEEIVCEPSDLALLPKVIWHLDEPVGDAIVIPMFLLSRAARKSVTVVLTGEGADEGLAGYFPHKVLVWSKMFRELVPRSLRQSVLEPLVANTPSEVLSMAFSYPSSLGKRGQQKLVDYLELIREENPEREYEFLLSLFDERHKVELYTETFKSQVSHYNLSYEGTFAFHQDSSDTLHKYLALQYSHWLPDDILMKQDKMSMANSIEARVPFLDHKLVEFFGTVPTHLKLKGFNDKILLRKYLKNQITGGAAKRPKKPFYIPIDKFFHGGPLREIFETCLSEESVKKRGYFEWKTVKHLIQNRSEKDFMIGKQLFSLLCLELWHRIFIDKEKGWL